MSSTAVAQGTAPSRRDVPASSRAWAWSGVAAGVLGIATIQASLATSVDWEKTKGDAAAMLEDASDKGSTFLVFHLLAATTAIVLPIFAAGLKRRLDQRTPVGSLLGSVAAWGLGLVSVALLLGSGLDTQFGLAMFDTTGVVPESAAFYTDWVATIPWLWLGAGLSGITLAVAALRHSAAPRWIGVVSVVLGGITLVTGLSPLQYLAGFTGPLWVLVVALGFALGERR